MKSLTFSCLICAINLYFAQILLRKAKTYSRLLESQQLLRTDQKLPGTIGAGLIEAKSINYSILAETGQLF